MAIKPTDCVIYIKDLIVYQESYRDSMGFYREEIRYVPYWQRFMEYVRQEEQRDGLWIPSTSFMAKILEQHNATYHSPKDYNKRYIKFRTHADLTMFILKWS